MTRNVVARFSAFLAVEVDGETLFQSDEGSVVTTQDAVVVANGDAREQLPLDSIAEFDFRTVPPEWEGFFDDLVGIRFEHEGEEYTVTIGTETETADRFVTVLLKLELDGTEAAIQQRQYPLDGDKAETFRAESELALLPKRERVNFDTADATPVDIGTITGVRPCDGDGIVIQHLTERGRVGTKLVPERDSVARLLQTYLDFRTEISSGAGPVDILYVGNERDTLVLLGKLLKHRNLEFEMTHADDVGAAARTIDDGEAVECVVCATQFAEEIEEALAEAGRSLPVVQFARGDPDGLPTAGDNGGETVMLDSRTVHYEDIADTIERGVIEARLGQ